MASAIAKTPPKALPSLPDTILRISKAGVAATAPARVRVPPSVRSPLPHQQGTDDIPGKTEAEIRVQFHNMPPGARVRTRVSGAALQIDTGRGVQTQVGRALSTTSPPDASVAAGGAASPAASAAQPAAGAPAQPGPKQLTEQQLKQRFWAALQNSRDKRQLPKEMNYEFIPKYIVAKVERKNGKDNIVWKKECSSRAEADAFLDKHKGFTVTKDGTLAAYGEMGGRNKGADNAEIYAGAVDPSERDYHIKYQGLNDKPPIDVWLDKGVWQEVAISDLFHEAYHAIELAARNPDYANEYKARQYSLMHMAPGGYPGTGTNSPAAAGTAPGGSKMNTPPAAQKASHPSLTPPDVDLQTSSAAADAAHRGAPAHLPPPPTIAQEGTVGHPGNNRDNNGNANSTGSGEPDAGKNIANIRDYDRLSQPAPGDSYTMDEPQSLKDFKAAYPEIDKWEAANWENSLNADKQFREHGLIVLLNSKTGKIMPVFRKASWVPQSKAYSGVDLKYDPVDHPIEDDPRLKNPDDWKVVYVSHTHPFYSPYDFMDKIYDQIWPNKWGNPNPTNADVGIIKGIYHNKVWGVVHSRDGWYYFGKTE